MKKFLILFSFVLLWDALFAQTTATPDKLWGQLFRDVQTQRVFADNKTFVDCTPKYAPAVILKKYEQEKTKKDFNLKAFVQANFNEPIVPDVQVRKGLSLLEHLEDLWTVLSRKADTVQPYSSL